MPKSFAHIHDQQYCLEMWAKKKPTSWEARLWLEDRCCFGEFGRKKFMDEEGAIFFIKCAFFHWSKSNRRTLEELREFEALLNHFTSLILRGPAGDRPAFVILPLKPQNWETEHLTRSRQSSRALVDILHASAAGRLSDDLIIEFIIKNTYNDMKNGPGITTTKDNHTMNYTQLYENGSIFGLLSSIRVDAVKANIVRQA